MVDGFGNGAAMITRMHHCIADGVSLARVMLSLTDAEPDAAIAPPPDRVEFGSGNEGGLLRIVASGAHALGMAGRMTAAALRHGGDTAGSPSHAARLAGAVARDGATLLRLMLTPADPATAIKGDPGVSRRVAWSERLSLRQIKDIAHAQDASVNDVLLAAVSGALRHYLQERGSRVGEIQAMVPFNLLPLDQPIPLELGNKFGLVFLPLPVGVSGAYRRLTEVHKRMDEIKHSRDGAVSYAVLSAAGLVPKPVERRVIDLFTGKGTAVMTSVPGPKEPVYLGGTAVRTLLVWAPTSGHIGMSVSIFSYRGEVTIGLMVDAALVPDPDRIVSQLERELEGLTRLSAGPAALDATPDAVIRT
jgi:diacylglycerol O-acyltransferase